MRRRLPITSLLFCILTINLRASASGGAEPPAVPLWPAGALEAGSGTLEEKVKNRSYDQNAYGLNRSISQVTAPTIAFHLPDEKMATRAAVVICPGGGFRRIVIDKEGHDVARWLNQKGVAGVVLKYRTCEPGAAESLADVQRAIQLVRSRAEELHIYAKGGHGYGLGIHGGAVAAWPETFHNWLRTIGADTSSPAVSADAAAKNPGTEYPDPMDDMRVPWEFSPEMAVLTNWLVCGEFPNPPHEGDEEYDHTPPCVGLETDYLAEHGGEAAIIPVEGMAHTRPDGTKAAWARHSMEHYGIDFRKFPGIREAQNRAAYAYTTLEREEAGEAVLGLGSDDGVRVWVNGKLVHENIVEREGIMDADIVPVMFRKGKNRILVKVESAGGSWYFKMRVASVPEMRAQATLYTKPLPKITRYPGAGDEVLEINTDSALYEGALHTETALVEVLAPGGQCVATEETPRGTWHLGPRHTGLFAALAPIYGSGDYRLNTEPEAFAKMTPLSRFFSEFWSSISHAESLLTTPLLIAQGDSDMIARVEGARYVALVLQRWGYNVRYWEVPGWGHWPLPEEYRLVEWLLQHKLNRNPHEVRIRANRLSSASVHWVEVQQSRHPFEFIRVNARVLNPTTVAIESKNALQIKLTPGLGLVSHAQPLSVIWNGRVVGEKAFQEGAVVVRQPDYHPSKGEKNATIEGSLRDRNNLPFAIVRGTASSDPGMRHVCKLKAETARDSWKERWNASPRYFLDTEITDDVIRNYSLELYGGPEANLVTRRLIDRLPFDINGDSVTIDTKTFSAKDSAVGVICPNPVNAERYVTVFAGTSLRGMYFCSRVEDNFDFSITDVRRLEEDDLKWGDLGIVMGNFDHRWAYDPEYAIEGNPELRARAQTIKGPEIGSARVDANRLCLGDLLEARALGTFADMRRDANWGFQPIRLGGKTYAKGIGVQAERKTSLVEYDIADGGWSRLKATIGIEMFDESRLRPGRLGCVSDCVVQ